MDRLVDLKKVVQHLVHFEVLAQVFYGKAFLRFFSVDRGGSCDVVFLN